MSVEAPVWHEGRARGADGTPLRYYGTRAPFGAAPTVLLVGSLGGERDAWRPQIRFLGDRMRFVTWDYRGLYDGPQRRHRTGRGRSGLDDHVADLSAVLAAAGAGRTVLFGCGLGVQLALEASLRLPEPAQPAALVLVAGPAGGAIAPPQLPRTLSRRLLLRAAHSLSGQRALAAAARKLRGRGGARWLRRFGVVGAAVELEDVEPWCERLGDVDPGALAAMLRVFGEHDALGRLDRITIPALILAGEADPLFAPAVAHQIGRRLAKSEVVIVPGGHHLLGLEFPELVNLRLERFFHDLGLC